MLPNNLAVWRVRDLEGIAMVGSLVSLAKCPYCPAGRGVLAVDVDELRGVQGVEYPHLDNGSFPPAIVFDPFGARRGPCEHLVDLLGEAGWEHRDPQGQEQLGGCLDLTWRHTSYPSTDHIGWECLTEFGQSVLRPGTDHPLRPRMPRITRSTDLTQPIPGVSLRRPWSLWVWGILDASYAPDAHQYCHEVRHSLNQFLEQRRG